ALFDRCVADVSWSTFDVTSRTFDELTARELHDTCGCGATCSWSRRVCVYPDVDGRDTEPGTVHRWIDRHGSIATGSPPAWYERLGFMIDGPEFVEDGIPPF
ncbi:MAG: hypothetical protein WKF60_05945, partial [Ilumatobacter sp.]